MIDENDAEAVEQNENVDEDVDGFENDEDDDGNNTQTGGMDEFDGVDDGDRADVGLAHKQ